MADLGVSGSPSAPGHSTNQPNSVYVAQVVSSQWDIRELVLTSLNEWHVGSRLTSCDPVAFRMILTHL